MNILSLDLGFCACEMEIVMSASSGPWSTWAFPAQKGEGQARERGHHSAHFALRVEYRGLGEMLWSFFSESPSPRDVGNRICFNPLISVQSRALEQHSSDNSVFLFSFWRNAQSSKCLSSSLSHRDGVWVQEESPLCSHG